MEDRLLFKAWDTLRKEWVDNIGISHDGQAIQFSENKISRLHIHNYKIVQSTGRRDKENNLIFEGHIMECEDGIDQSTESGFDWEEIKGRVVIVWNLEECKFDIENNQMIDRETFFEEIANYKIIGHIFQDSHLIKKK